jgi:hypothetical protein
MASVGAAHEGEGAERVTEVQMLYVVVGDDCQIEYGQTWVAGIYQSRQEAVRMAHEKLEQAAQGQKIHGEWAKKRFAIMASSEHQYAWEYGKTPGFAARVLNEIGPEPELPKAYDYAVYAVPMGVWGCWDGPDLSAEGS